MTLCWKSGLVCPPFNTLIFPFVALPVTFTRTHCRLDDILSFECLFNWSWIYLELISKPDSKFLRNTIKWGKQYFLWDKSSYDIVKWFLLVKLYAKTVSRWQYWLAKINWYVYGHSPEFASCIYLIKITYAYFWLWARGDANILHIAIFMSLSKSWILSFDSGHPGKE